MMKNKEHFTSIKINDIEIIQDIINASITYIADNIGGISRWHPLGSDWIELKLVVNSQTDFVSKYYQFFKEKYFKIEL